MSEGAPLKQLPKLLDPRKFAQQNAKLAGIVPEDSLSRLRDLSDGRSVANVRAELEFFVDEQGRRRLSGSVETTLSLVCQRCLEAMPVSVKTVLKLVVVRDEEQAENLPRDLDPWFVTEEQGDLHFALEEEVLLALPATARHEYACIEAESLHAGPEVDDKAQSSERENPFSVLSDLKKTLKSTE